MYRRVECHFLRERFGAYLLLAPEEAEAQKIRAHLAVCPACRSALGGYFLLELWEEDGIVPSPDGAGLVRAVMKRLEGGEATPGLSETRISRKKIFSLPLKSEPGLKVSPRRVEALVKSGSPCNPGAKAHDREGNRASRVLWNYLAAAWPPFFFPSGTASKPWPTWPCRAVVYKKGSGPSTVRLDKSSSGVLEKIYSSEISTKGDERMRKNKTWVFVLSFIPGVGHYYLGLMQRGLQFNLLFFGALAIIGFTRLEGFSLFLPVIWFYNLFDALHLADAYAREGGVQDRPFLSWEKIPLWHSFLGWVLIILGLYSFLASDLFLSWHILPPDLEIEKLFIAAVLIGTGIYLLFGRRRLK